MIQGFGQQATNVTDWSNSRYSLKTSEELKRKIRLWLGIFILFLILSGITAFPLAWEIGILREWTQQGSLISNLAPGLTSWIGNVHEGIRDTYSKYPFMAYGTDWLAFAHIVIAIVFIGPLKDPVKNIWVIESGMIACVLVIPLALICGQIRGIPLSWRLIDCSFGVFGFIPLWVSYHYTKELERKLLTSR